MSSSVALALADAVLIVHWAFAAFIVLGLALVWLGAWRGWGFVRWRSFRLAHLGAMGVVLAESLLGVFCPLTELEYALRRMGGTDAPHDTTFMADWAARLFYWDLPEVVFTALYAGIFILMLLSWRLVPPRTTCKP